MALKLCPKRGRFGRLLGFWKELGQGGSTYPFDFLVLVNLGLLPTPGTPSAAQDPASTSQDPAADLMILE
jgi:hypothetical protein